MRGEETGARSWHWRHALAGTYVACDCGRRWTLLGLSEGGAPLFLEVPKEGIRAGNRVRLSGEQSGGRGVVERLLRTEGLGGPGESFGRGWREPDDVEGEVSGSRYREEALAPERHLLYARIAERREGGAT